MSTIAKLTLAVALTVALTVTGCTATLDELDRPDTSGPPPSTTPTTPTPPGPAPTPSVSPAPGDDRPNVVLFLVDDMRADDLTWMPKTRRLLGAAGATLPNFVSSHPICCPARAELLTAQYAQNNGVRHNKGLHGGYAAFNPDATIATALDDAGYHTSLHGKYLNRYQALTQASTEPGWDTWDPLVEGVYDFFDFGFANGDTFTDDYVTDRLTERSLAVIDAATAADAPFFVMVNHVAPHYAFGPSWPTTYNPPPPAPRHAGVHDDAVSPSTLDPAFNEADVSDKPPSYRTPHTVDPAYAQEWFAARVKALASVDEGVAATVAALRASGELENTYLVFTSDNGYVLGEHRQMRKNRFYNQVLTVPFLISGPGIDAGTTRPEIANLADLGATLLDIGAAPARHTVDGASFLHLLTGETSAGSVRPVRDRQREDRRSPAPNKQHTRGPLPDQVHDRGRGDRQRAHRKDRNAAQGKDHRSKDHRSRDHRGGAGWRDTTLLLSGRTGGDGWKYRGVRTDRYTYGEMWHNPGVAMLFDRLADPHELTSLADDPDYAGLVTELHRRTQVLSACAGADCHRTFGPLPAGSR